MGMYIDGVSGRGHFKKFNRTTKKYDKIFFEDLLGNGDHPVLKEAIQIGADCAHDSFFLFVGFAARKSIGDVLPDEMENAFEYVCKTVRDPRSPIGLKRFVKTTFLCLQPSNAQKVYLNMMGQC